MGSAMHCIPFVAPPHGGATGGVRLVKQAQTH